MIRRLSIAVLLCLVCGCHHREERQWLTNSHMVAAADSADRTKWGYALTHTEMRGMSLRLLPNVTMQVSYLSGEATPLFDFSPNDINRQISAGYVKVREDGGLTIYAPAFVGVNLPPKGRLPREIVKKV